MQLQQQQSHAVQAIKKRCNLLGEDMGMRSACGVTGYAARCELSDNMKAILRPVSIMVPDKNLIAQIEMFSEGFSTAKVDPQVLPPTVHHTPATQLVFGASAAMCLTCPPLELCLC